MPLFCRSSFLRNAQQDGSYSLSTYLTWEGPSMWTDESIFPTFGSSWTLLVACLGTWWPMHLGLLISTRPRSRICSLAVSSEERTGLKGTGIRGFIDGSWSSSACTAEELWLGWLCMMLWTEGSEGVTWCWRQERESELNSESSSPLTIKTCYDWPLHFYN